MTIMGNLSAPLKKWTSWKHSKVNRSIRFGHVLQLPANWWFRWKVWRWSEGGFASARTRGSTPIHLPERSPLERRGRPKWVDLEGAPLEAI